MHDGRLIRSLRISKKLTQAELAEGICSKTSLVGLEKGTVRKIAFTTLQAVLARLNVSLAEYEVLRHRLEEPTKSKRTRRLLSKVQEENFDPYKEVGNNRKRFKQTGDLYYLVLNIHMFLKTDSQLQKELQFEFLRYECKKIEDYFMRIQEYSQFEMTILAELPFLFSESFIESNYVKIKKRMRNFSLTNNPDQYMDLFLLNLTTHYIAKKRFKKARNVNDDLARSLAAKAKNLIIYETLMMNYQKQLILVGLGELIDEDECNQLFSVLEYSLGREQRRQLEEQFRVLLP